MFKKIQLALFFFGMSAASYAYVIETNFTIENHTDIPMTIAIDQPWGQDKITKSLAAHDTVTLKMQNGDTSGLLYQTSIAPFKIESADAKTFVNGFVAYYVGGSVMNKYSFLHISSQRGLTVDSVYSCANGGANTILDNKLIIEETSDTTKTKLIKEIRCEGIKSSTINKINQEYQITCSDDTNSLFHQRMIYSCTTHTCEWEFFYTNGEKRYWPKYSTRPETLHTELDAMIGKSFCANW